MGAPGRSDQVANSLDDWKACAATPHRSHAWDLASARADLDQPATDVERLRVGLEDW
jgi:hypothetical protein